MANVRNTREVAYDRRAVGTFKNRRDIEAALQDLKNADVDMNRVSLIARHIEEVEGAEEVGNQGNEAKEGAAAGATAGTVLGGIGGFLVGAGVLAIPGVGPILAAGVGISELAATLAGAGIGAATGGIVGALVGAGIPEERAREYNDRVKAGEYLLMVNCDEDDMERVESIMRNHHVEEFGIFAAPDLLQGKRTSERFETSGEKATMADVSDRTVTKTYDLDHGSDPEVLIVDHRKDARKDVR